MNIQSISRKMAAMLMLALGMQSVQAQDMHFSQFNGAPMILNPALAGGISGMYRVTGIYRNQWNSVTTPYVTFGGSFDAPIKRDIAIDDHLGGGISIYNDRSGDGNLANLTAMATAAYHKFFGENSNMSLSVGLQGGFTQKTIDLQRLYWGDEFRNGGFQGGTTGELLKPKVQHFTAAAGLNWQHAIGESQNFAYSIGLSGHNLNQPRESFLQKTNNEVGLGMRLNAQLGVIWYANPRLVILPALLYQSQTAATETIVGSEFKYLVGEPDIRSVATAVFLGGYTRMGDAAIITAGLELKGFRLGVAYDYNTSDLKSASGGNGGFEINLRYVQPHPLDFAKKVNFPCARF